jgi:hypothetical protein
MLSTVLFLLATKKKRLIVFGAIRRIYELFYVKYRGGQKLQDLTSPEDLHICRKQRDKFSESRGLVHLLNNKCSIPLDSVDLSRLIFYKCMSPLDSYILETLT